MNFQVPQFIDQEPKIICPLTIKQFLYIGAAAGLSFIAFQIFNFFFWFMFSVILGAIALSLAFLKINGQDFPKILVSAVGYLWQPRIYTWQRKLPETSIDMSEFEKINALRRSITLGDKFKTAALQITTSKFFSKTKSPSERYQAVTYVTGEKGVAKRIDY